MWYPGSGVVLDLSFPDLCYLSYFLHQPLAGPCHRLLKNQAGSRKPDFYLSIYFDGLKCPDKLGFT